LYGDREGVTITMKKRIFAALIVGVVLAELLSAALPASLNRYYIDVLVGSFAASLIGGRVIMGVVIAAYVVSWKVAGLFFMANHYGTKEVGPNLQTFLFDYAIVFILGVVFGWAGASLSRYISRQKKTVV
jgi:ABC-type multidrug transport system fused ATPase/permease subunit